MRTKIIAEAAQGYEGKVEYCDLYVKAAAKAGATAVKFQIVYADDTAEPGYQHYEFFKTLEMGVPIWQRIRALAADLDILFFADVSGERAMEVARAITPDGIKIHSSNFFNRPLIKQAFETADGGHREAVIDGETGLLARVDDPADFARRALDLLADPATGAALARAGRGYAEERFSIEAHVATMTTLYDRLVECSQ